MILLLLWRVIVLTIIYLKKHENPQQIYIQVAYMYLLGVLVFRGLFLVIKKKTVLKEYLIITFHNFQIQVWNTSVPQMIEI